MPNALKREGALFQNLNLRAILRRGGEWPDWNGPFGQMTLRLAISELASSIADEKLQVQIKRLANQNISRQRLTCNPPRQGDGLEESVTTSG